MPLTHFGELRLQELLGIEVFTQALGKRLSRRPATRQPPGFQQRGLDSDVGAGLVQALLNRSNRVTDFETEIPAGTHKLFIVPIRIGHIRSKQEQIDIRVRI